MGVLIQKVTKSGYGNHLLLLLFFLINVSRHLFYYNFETHFYNSYLFFSHAFEFKKFVVYCNLNTKIKNIVGLCKWFELSKNNYLNVNYF